MEVSVRVITLHQQCRDTCAAHASLRVRTRELGTLLANEERAHLLREKSVVPIFAFNECGSLNEGTAWTYRNEGARSRRRLQRRKRFPSPVVSPPVVWRSSRLLLPRSSPHSPFATIALRKNSIIEHVRAATAARSSHCAVTIVYPDRYSPRMTYDPYGACRSRDATRMKAF